MAFVGEQDSLRPEIDKSSKRNSYFEMLSSISTELDLMLNDLKKKESFTPSSPTSPLAKPHAFYDTNERSLSPRQDKQPTTDEFLSGLPSSAASNNTSRPSSFASMILPHGQASSGGPGPPLGHSLHDNALTMKTRLVHTKPIWFLPSTRKPAAAHYLQGQPVGTFIVRQARQKDKLCLTLKHPGTGKGPYIESYPIKSLLQGVKLETDDMVFSVLDDLIAHHMQIQAGLPCRLILPRAVMTARNLREIQSLAVLEEDFWKSAHSKSPTLPSARDSLIDLNQRWVEIPSHSKASLNQHQSGDSLVTKPNEKLKKLDKGMYGVFTLPPVIYENTEKKLDSRRPSSLGGTNPTQNVWGERKSNTIPLLSNQRPTSDFDRQDMRFSSTSEFEFVTSTTEPRYPPPSCAPPPPPTGDMPFNVFMMPSVPAKYSWSQVRPSSVEYSLPSERFKNPLEEKILQACGNANQGEYSTPGLECVTRDAYHTLESSTTSLISHREERLPHQHANYWAPPPPVTCRQSKSSADSLQLAAPAAPRAGEQIQNILQPVTCNSSATREPAVGHALPEFDPLFTARESPCTTVESADDFMVRDVKNEIKADTANNNTPDSIIMAPMSSTTARTPCALSHNVDSTQRLSDPQVEENVERQDDSSQSDFEVSSLSSGVPFTENENGNHLLLSQSTELNETLEDAEFEQSREEEKKDYKRNKSGLSNFNKLKVLAKKGSRGATKKLHRISGKSKKKDPSTDIHEAILSVAANSSIGLGALVHGFIRTQEEKCETDKPDVVLRSIRQFMSGTKNYLLNKREPEIDAVIDRHMGELDLATLEGIVENALHRCVLQPLKSDIGMSCLNEYNRNGSMALMDHNIMEAKKRTPEELGIKPNYIPPEGEDLEEIRQLFSQLQEAYSPLTKLDLLLQIVTAIYKSVKDKGSDTEVTNSMGADDFLPMLIYVLVQCEMISIEIEADYMWGLLDPSMLSGEGGYYLTTLSSAICVLKQFEEDNSNIETQGFLTVLAAINPDPTCITLKTLPVLPGMKANEVCDILARRLGLADAEDYKLYLLQDSQEILVEDFECPLKIKNDEEAGGSRGCRFGFRPTHTEIIWPRTSGLVSL